MKFEAG